MYSVIMYDISDSIKHTVYSPDKTSKGYVLLSAKVVNEIDKAGSFTFTISKSHPHYSDFRKIRTMIYVMQDKRVLWFGRVYEIQRDFCMNKTITCEGALTFLNDICIMPYMYLEDAPPGSDYKYITKLVTKYEHLTYIMDLYNFRCHQSRKIQFTTNILPELHTYAEIYGSDSYNNILTEIENSIIGELNYHILPVYSVDSKDGRVVTTINIGTMPFGESKQKIEFGKNLIDFEEFISAANIYNSIIPVGAGNISLFSDNGSEISPIELKDRAYYVGGGMESDCGVIDKVINFDSINDRSELWNAAQNILLNGGGVPADSFTINAIDLHLLDVNTDEICVGDEVQVISAPHSINNPFVCRKEEIDLFNPASTRYLFSTKDKISPETLTDLLYDDVTGFYRRLNKKISLGQTCGVVKMDADKSSFSLIMRKG